MSDSECPPSVARLIERVISSMDHVEVLVRLSRTPGVPVTPEQLSADGHIDPSLLVRVIRDLEHGELIVGSEAGYVLVEQSPDQQAVQALVDMYRTRPVTLVRAIYARMSPVRTFADAFRLRRKD